MYQLVYTSKAVQPVTDEYLMAILTFSQNNNWKLGISGMLLYVDGHFLQFLEGKKESIQSLYKKIQQDLRHTDVTILIESEAHELLFPGWAMAFHKTSSSELPTNLFIFEPNNLLEICRNSPGKILNVFTAFIDKAKV